MGERLTEIFVSDAQIGDTIHTSEGALTVETCIVEDGPGAQGARTVWWVLFGRDHRGKFRRLRFEGSEVAWCLRESGDPATG